MITLLLFLAVDLDRFYINLHQNLPHVDNFGIKHFFIVDDVLTLYFDIHKD